jgi:lysophospholipase L1-like esterase
MINDLPRKTLNVDRSNLLPLYTLKEHDDVILKLALFKNSVSFDITGQTIRLGAKTSAGLKEQNEGFTIDKSNLDIVLKNSILSQGLVELDLQFIDANGQMTTASFFISVGAKVLNDNAVEASNEFDTFKKTVEEIQGDYQGLRTIMIDENNAANLQDQVNQVTASLEQKANTNKIIDNQFQKGLVNTIAKLNAGEKAKIIFIGDSTTADNSYSSPNHVTLVRDYLTDIYGDKVTVLNKGIDGNKSEDIASRIHKDVINENPDAIFICVGINDEGNSVPMSDIIKNMTYIFTQIKTFCKKDVEVVYRSPNPQKNINGTSTPKFDKISQEIKKSCYMFGYLHIDYLNEFKSWGLTQEQADEYYHDPIHPNTGGQYLIFDFIKPLFRNVYVKEVTYAKTIPFKLNSSAFNGTTYALRNSTANPNASNMYNNEFFDSSAVVGNVIQFRFYGTRCGFSYASMASHGQVKISIDDVTIVPVLDCYSTTVKWNNEYITPLLEVGWHTLKIELLGTTSGTNKNSQIGNFYVIVDELKEFVSVENRNKGIVYSTGGNLEGTYSLKNATGIISGKNTVGVDVPLALVNNSNQAQFGSTGAEMLLRSSSSGIKSTIGSVTGFVMTQKVAYASLSTALRPTGLTVADKGCMIYDNTINKPIWWNGTTWIDAVGTTV